MRRAPTGAVVVLELQGWASPGAIRLVRDTRRVGAGRGVHVIAVAEGPWRTTLFGGRDCAISTAVLSEPTALAEAAGLPRWCPHRLHKLAGRQAAIRHDAARTWPTEAVVDALGRSGRGLSILDRLTTNLLDLSSHAQQVALATCLATGYWHARLATDVVTVSELRPWVVPLEQGWGWLRPIWVRTLRRCLAARVVRPRSHPPRRVAPPAAQTAAPAASQQGFVQARLMGSFELSIDGLTVQKWSGKRGPSVLRYLLSRRRHTCSRDELLDAFWPDITPDVARNRLQVAISGLRRALLKITNLHVIEYADGDYRLNPELRVEVDVEQFEQGLSKARRAERCGDLKAALAAYREAVDCYRGDFAADAPYEQWTLLTRESLRITYIDALDRLSRIQLSVGTLDDCIATGHRMLDVDPCSEDAHRLLMRCYASLGRGYQALRQYEFCCRVLKQILGTEPLPETARLYRAIRTGSLQVPAPTD
jgi:DNA-binding SARP family transcriptional activator